MKKEQEPKTRLDLYQINIQEHVVKNTFTIKVLNQV